MNENNILLLNRDENGALYYTPNEGLNEKNQNSGQWNSLKPEINNKLNESTNTKRGNKTVFDGGGGNMSNYVTKEELKSELNLLESKIDNKFLELKLELKNQQSSNIRWMIGTAIGIVGVIIAAIKLF